jgi:hypothetical protein
VTPGSVPFRQVRPPSLDVAQPIAEAAPVVERPIWNADTTVLPFAALSGSTALWCCPTVSVRGSTEICFPASLTAALAATAPAKTAARRSQIKGRAGGVR